jgi:hypothetical protein
MKITALTPHESEVLDAACGLLEQRPTRFVILEQREDGSLLDPPSPLPMHHARSGHIHNGSRQRDPPTNLSV